MIKNLFDNNFFGNAAAKKALFLENWLNIFIIYFVRYTAYTSYMENSDAKIRTSSGPNKLPKNKPTPSDAKVISKLW